MGFEHLIHEMTTKPGDFAVSWVVLLTLVVMSAMSWYWTVINIFRATRLKSAADRVVSLFWDTPNAQDAIRAMEEQPASEPFSKIALDAAQAAAHHQRAEGGATGGVGENLSRSEFVDRALRQAVTRESNKLQSGMTCGHRRCNRSVRRSAGYRVHLRRADQDRCHRLRFDRRRCRPGG